LLKVGYIKTQDTKGRGNCLRFTRHKNKEQKFIITHNCATVKNLTFFQKKGVKKVREIGAIE
jgi:hypothetical protein